MNKYDADQELMEAFEANSSELYQLAFLLTGNADRSVAAFDNALDFNEVNHVFGGFMKEWARKLIIGQALGAIDSELRTSKQRVSRTARDEDAGAEKWKRRADISQEEFEEAVVAIDAFPRCAMLLTIFEGMSLKDAAMLLNSNESLTAAAQRIGLVELTRNLAGPEGRDPYPETNPVPVLSLG
jgi:hypothetical protein